jgi:hypothetical protein
LCDLTTHVEWSPNCTRRLSGNADDVYLTNQAAYLLDAGIGDIALEIGDPHNRKHFFQSLMHYKSFCQKLRWVNYQSLCFFQKPRATTPRAYSRRLARIARQKSALNRL